MTKFCGKLAFVLLSILTVTQAQKIHKIDTQEKVICLTFDDGPLPGNTDQILDILESHDATATFFVIGNRVGKAAESLRRVKETGNEIGNHTRTHRNLTELDAVADIEEEIFACGNAVKAATGYEPVVFRAPYLAEDERVYAVQEALHLPTIHCSVDTRDWDSASTEESILEAAIGGIEPGAVVLMHEFSDKTIKILPQLLDAIKAKGYRTVSVSEAIELSH